MLVSTPVREERSEWKDIYGEKKRAKDRASRNPRCRKTENYVYLSSYT